MQLKEIKHWNEILKKFLGVMSLTELQEKLNKFNKGENITN